eukprot:scaffold39525_cov139-Skeletonema_dohrnii-CCMP3373.AAC.3
MASSRRTLLTSAAKLPTAFDYWSHRLHASLGLYVFSHLMYRYYLFFTHHRDMGFDALTSSGDEDTTEATIFVMLFVPHLLLQLSGFAFSLPNKRHPDGNRIWPQYRWEALVFCARCLSLSFIAWRRKMNNWKLEDGSCSIVPAAFCVVFTMILADQIAKSYGTKKSRTIRDLKAPQWSQYLMSSAQFHATVHCILISDTLSVQIAALTVVQLSAFGMTMRRKGFISQKEGVFLYALVLLEGMIVIFDDLMRRSIFNLALFLGNSTAVLRMYFGMNKYLMWSGVVAIVLFLQRKGILSDDAFSDSLPLLNYASWLLLVSTCYWKCR